MEELDTPHPDYLKGFNEGYLIAKHEPSLAEKLVSIEGGSERLNGLKKGMEEFAQEKQKENTPAFLKKDRLSSINKTVDKDKGEMDKE